MGSIGDNPVRKGVERTSIPWEKGLLGASGPVRISHTKKLCLSDAMRWKECKFFLTNVKQVDNEALARLLDADKLLFGKVESKAWRGDWLEVQFRIFMRDY